jgi:hypothetical protein
MVLHLIPFLFFSDLYTTSLLQDKLLSKLEENEPELATSQEDEVSFVSLKRVQLLRIHHA